MTIIKIIIIVILLQLLIMKIMKIKMMLIRLILLRHSSSNKVKILGRNFISKDLILTSFFIRPGSPKNLFLHNLLRQQTIPNTGAEFNWYPVVCWYLCSWLMIKWSLSTRASCLKCRTITAITKGITFQIACMSLKYLNNLGTCLQKPAASSN